MAFKRREEPTSIDDEREALRAQHAALEDLKRQLAERIEAVRDREHELRVALIDAGTGKPTTVLLPPAAPAHADTGEDALEAERRERALVAREQAVAAREAQAEQREREQRAAEATTASAAEREPGAARLAEIEARLAELRDAEKVFLRTRDELAGRSEAVAARERLVAQRERELDEREDGTGEWAKPELTEMESRLRRLEQQQAPGEQTLGFSGGLKKLEQGTRQRRS